MLCLLTGCIYVPYRVKSAIAVIIAVIAETRIPAFPASKLPSRFGFWGTYILDPGCIVGYLGKSPNTRLIFAELPFG